MGARKAIIEEFWYLRGASTYLLLQESQCKFWDAHTPEGGLVGLNSNFLDIFRRMMERR